MSDLHKFQRKCYVFLARLRAMYEPDAPDLLRQMADELEWLKLEEFGDVHDREM